MRASPAAPPRSATRATPTQTLLQCRNLQRQKEKARGAPAPLSRARVGVRLQPASAAAPQDQPYHPDSSRLACRSRSGSGASDAVLGPRRFRGQNKCACGMVGFLAIHPSPQQPFSSSPIHDSGETPGANHAMEKKEVLDGRCIMSLGPQSPSAVRQRTGSRIFRGTYLPRRGLQRGRQTQEIIFAHSPHEGVFHNRPTLQGNLLCRSDWLCLRGFAETESAIFLVRELAALPRRLLRFSTIPAGS